MVARCYPPEPRFATESEREVFDLLHATLPADAVLMANYALHSEHHDYELDLVALLPGEGVIVIEVKGGSVWYDGHWWVRGGGQDREIHPVRQAREGSYQLRSLIEDDPRWTRGRMAYAHAVVAPYSSFGADFATPDCPRSMVHGREDLPDLVGRLIEGIRTTAADGARPDADDVARMVEIAQGRGFTAPDFNAEVIERQSQADRLTQEQAMLLGVTRLLNRVEIRGGAGSGKTVLALAQARELTAGRAGRKAQRVALLCYSYGLAASLERAVAEWPRRHRPAYVGTYEGLARTWGITEFGDREDSEFWENRLPALMAERAAELTPGKRFDAFVVDEAQDFAEDWWTPLLRAFADPETGGLYVYSDENQRIFSRFGAPPVPLVPLVLDHNLRNTRQIYQAFEPLAPTRMQARGGDGAAVDFIPATDERILEYGDEVVSTLLDAGWDPRNIALMTTGRRHPVQVRETERLGQQGYWRTWTDQDEVFYGHVLGCKGLERAAVVLCLNEGSGTDSARHRSREKLYVGMSRATDRLIVIGDPATMREIGGEQVAQRLGL